MITRRKFAISLAALPLGSRAITTAHAEGYPAKAVRIVVPFPAGGSTDVGARLIADYLSRSFGRRDRRR
jgi:tripartite-type tricarboxylate transporter receptor subunit TctC